MRLSIIRDIVNHICRGNFRKRVPLLSSKQTSPSWVVFSLALAGLASSFMQTILIPIQAQLPTLLNAQPNDTAWLITITLLVSAISTPIAGRLSDMFGKKLLIVILLGLLIAGSVIGAWSSTLIPLIIARGLQGAGMGVIPVGISLLRDAMPPSDSDLPSPWFPPPSEWAELWGCR